MTFLQENGQYFSSGQNRQNSGITLSPRRQILVTFE
jgi:hypothetical protein